MARNYYLILGIPIDAAPEAIRSAFRKKAKRYHPDHVGAKGAREFHAACEAYEVLSDPVRRARYDHELEHRASAAREAEAVRRTEPEPLVAEAMPVTGEPDAVRPSFEALFERLLGNFATTGRPKAEHEEPLHFELILSPEEAARGVVVPFRVPVLAVCPSCGGSGRTPSRSCDDCEGEGRIVDQRRIEARIPPGIRDGAIVEVSMRRLGVHNLWLELHVRIAAH
jgi:DnaJ-class molecular chaperone